MAWFFWCLYTEKAIAPHSSTLPGKSIEEPDGLPSIGSHRVGHDWSDLAAAAACYSNDSLTDKENKFMVTKGRGSGVQIRSMEFTDTNYYTRSR